MARTAFILAVAVMSVGFLTPTLPAQLPPQGTASGDQPVHLLKAPAGFEKVYEMKVGEFEDFTIKDERFTINNVILKESNDGRRGQASIRFSATVRNKAKGYENFSITLIGFDEKKVPIWASKAATTVDGNWINILQDYETPVTKGTLKATNLVWLKVNVSFNSDEDE